MHHPSAVLNVLLRHFADTSLWNFVNATRTCTFNQRAYLIDLLFSSTPFSFLFLAFSFSRENIDMEYDASLVSIDRESSIECEPRTLTIDQLHYAREAALYVVHTRSMEDATRIFTEGLKPVASASRKTGEMMMNLSEDMSYSEDDFQHSGIKEVSSAPF